MYDVLGGIGDCNCVVLNDIYIDIMDYIVLVFCIDLEFRWMWVEFEWENKVKVFLLLCVVFFWLICDGILVFYFVKGD